MRGLEPLGMVSVMSVEFFLILGREERRVCGCRPLVGIEPTGRNTRCWADQADCQDV